MNWLNLFLTQNLVLQPRMALFTMTQPVFKGRDVRQLTREFIFIYSLVHLLLINVALCTPYVAENHALLFILLPPLIKC